MSGPVGLPGFEKPKAAKKQGNKKKPIRTKAARRIKGATVPDFEKELEVYKDCSTDVLTVERVPKWERSTFRRWWRYREQQKLPNPKGISFGIFLDHGIKHLCSAGEVGDFCTELELAESMENLTVYEQTRIDDIVATFNYTVPDAGGGYCSWSNRVPVEAIETLVNVKTALACKPSDLAPTCVAFGLIHQPGVSAEASKLAIQAMDGLIAAFDQRRELLARVMKGFEERRPPKV